jgi:hypothetical protein
MINQQQQAISQIMKMTSILLGKNYLEGSIPVACQIFGVLYHAHKLRSQDQRGKKVPHNSTISAVYGIKTICIRYQGQQAS